MTEQTSGARDGDLRPGRSLAWFEQGEGLSGAEALLVEKIQQGEAAVIGRGERPEPADQRADVTVRAELIRFLALGGGPDCRPHEKGVRLIGARISGMIDLEGCVAKTPIVLMNCALDATMILAFAEIGLLNLTGSRLQGAQDLPALVGDGLICSAGVIFSHAEAIGEMRFPQADIRGSLIGQSASVDAAGAQASLFAEAAKIGGGVFLDGLSAAGAVRMARAQVGADVGLSDARLSSEDGASLNLDGVACGGALRLNGALSRGEVRLLGARVGDNLEWRGGGVENPGEDALSLDSAVIQGSLMLREGFSAHGETRLVHIRVGQSLECMEAAFRNPGGAALSADGASIGGSVVVGRGFAAVGEVRFLEAAVAGAFDAHGGAFDGAGGSALSLERARIGGPLFLRRARAVRTAADAPPMFVGRVELSGARARELVDAPEDWPARGQLVLDGFVYDRFDGDAAPQDAGRRVAWLRRQTSEHLGSDFRSQPWAQLAKVLRDAGKPLEARRVGVARERARLRGGQISWWAQPLHRLYGVIAGYGYFTFRALAFALAFWGLGAAVFAAAWQDGAFAPRGSAIFEDPVWRACAADPSVGNPAACWTAPGKPGADHEPFNALLYAFDVLVPFVSIELEAGWSPAAGRGTPLAELVGGSSAPSDARWTVGDLAWAYRIFHELMGFVLTGFAAAGAARLVREE